MRAHARGGRGGWLLSSVSNTSDCPSPQTLKKVRTQRVDSAAFSVLRGGEGEGIILYMSCEGGGGGVGWKRIADSDLDPNSGKYFGS